MKLLIDMGNSRLKWAVWQNGQLNENGVLLNEQVDLLLLASVWANLNPTEVLISCVSTNQLLFTVKNALYELWAIEPKVARSDALAVGVKNGYVEPETLGVDRWLALIAARHFYQGSVCVADCGTAITIDVLNADGEHLGGFISAGIGLMKQALSRGTNALPLVDALDDVHAANSTKAAIHSGTVLAAVGLIETVLAREAENFQLVLTGGDAELIAPLLSVTPVINKELVLFGLVLLF